MNSTCFRERGRERSCTWPSLLPGGFYSHRLPERGRALHFSRAGSQKVISRNGLAALLAASPGHLEVALPDCLVSWYPASLWLDSTLRTPQLIALDVPLGDLLVASLATWAGEGLHWVSSVLFMPLRYSKSQAHESEF